MSDVSPFYLEVVSFRQSHKHCGELSGLVFFYFFITIIIVVVLVRKQYIVYIKQVSDLP